MLVVGTFLAALAVTISAVVRLLLMRNPLPGLRGKNFKGVDLPMTGGVMILVTFLLVEGLFALIAGAAQSSAPDPLPTALLQAFFSNEHLGSVILVMGFCLLGLLDDFAGNTTSKGFRGHVSAMHRGIITTGAIKATGGFCIALIVGAMFEASVVASLLDALVIVLTANVLNLLDLRPGRSVKGFFLIWIPLSLITWTTPYLPASAAVVAAAAVWLSSDLKEEAMLGDGGANLLGAVAGAGLAIATTVPAKIAALLLLILVTAASEKWSFTSVIDRTRPLRWFDSLGRVPEETEPF